MESPCNFPRACELPTRAGRATTLQRNQRAASATGGNRSRDRALLRLVVHLTRKIGRCTAAYQVTPIAGFIRIGSGRARVADPMALPVQHRHWHSSDERRGGARWHSMRCDVTPASNRSFGMVPKERAYHVSNSSSERRVRSPNPKQIRWHQTRQRDQRDSGTSPTGRSGASGIEAAVSKPGMWSRFEPRGNRHRYCDTCAANNSRR